MRRLGKLNQGFTVVEAFFLLLIVGVIGTIGWRLLAKNSSVNAKNLAPLSAQSVQTTTNLSYGTDPLQTMDIYWQKGAAKPIVIMVHGGGWSAGDKTNISANALQIAQAGYTVANINYRLDSPTVVGFPMEVNDVKSATNLMISLAGKYNGISSRVSYIGGSAGGNLVDLATEQLNTQTPGKIKNNISLSATGIDFVATGQYYVSTGTTNTNFEQYLGCQPVNCTVETETAASQALNATATSCATYLLFNSDNELVPLTLAQELNDKLKSASCSSTLQVISGTQHGFSYWSQVKPTIVQFLDSH